MVLKYLNICLNINLEDDSYAKGIFFGFSFIDLFNDIIVMVAIGSIIVFLYIKKEDRKGFYHEIYI